MVEAPRAPGSGLVSGKCLEVRRSQKRYHVHVSLEGGLRMRKMLSVGSRIAAVAVMCLVGSTGVASPWWPLLAVDNREGHRSSLRARVTMADGTARTITLQGVGCTESLCSRVRAKDTKADDVWLDRLASVREISHNAAGPVKAVFTFKDGLERQVSIIQWHRVLYVEGRFGRTETLDLASLARIDFE